MSNFPVGNLAFSMKFLAKGKFILVQVAVHLVTT